MTTQNSGRGLGRILALVALAATMGLSACGDRAERVRFNGEYYPAKVSRDRDTRKQFQVSVRRVDRGLLGAREAGRYAATRYCLKEFGTSNIDWVNGPDAEDGRLSISNGRLSLSGACVTW
ncbi:hypothetical protein [Roseovarius sp. MMSF_3281]|uniref:hypothetical protein n=1 Tax=Roseovarius sp. MMSF_3281 TaxID=3046694 RepID=UPI00273F0420|nr:hypothetical protein [Roseovarius sp. MMSF_3281]